LINFKIKRMSNKEWAKYFKQTNKNLEGISDTMLKHFENLETENVLNSNLGKTT
jgi:hypothetical protein